MLIYLLEFSFHSVESLEDVGVKIIKLQWATTVGKSVGLLIKGTKIIQVLLDLFTVPRIDLGSTGRKSTTLRQIHRNLQCVLLLIINLLLQKLPHAT